jgi:membrane-associated phospholipid phosphatase
MIPRGYRTGFVGRVADTTSGLTDGTSREPSVVAVTPRWTAFTLTHWRKRYRNVRFRLVDINCIGYMAVIGVLLVFFHREVPSWYVDVLVHLAFVIGALELVRVAERNPHRTALWVARTFYPIVFYTYCFIEFNRTTRMFAGTFWMSEYLVRADKALFGTHPTVWAERFYSPWLDELMAICYCTYYLAAPIIAGCLFFRGKREDTLAGFSIVTFGYFVNYVLFYVFPAVSPRMIPWLADLHARDYTGYVIASALRLLEGSEGVVTGGCFPSSHVTGALSWALVGWRYDRKVGVVFLILTVGVVISTVYHRYHHAVDPLAGVVLGFVCYAMAIRILRRRGEDPLHDDSAGDGSKRVCRQSSR